MTDQIPGTGSPPEGQAPAPIPPPPDRPPRNATVSVLMVIGGVILLLPGLCSLFFMVMLGSNTGSVGALGLLWLSCFIISAGGIAMLVRAFR
jgi:hypothetical protein